MTTTSAVRVSVPVALVAALSLAIAACSSAAAPSAPPTASPPASAAPSDDAGASPSGPDTGVGSPSDPGGGGGGGLGGVGGGAAVVIPHPGTVNSRPVAVERIETSVDGHRVTAKLTWTSGVEPCYVLDSVVISRDGNDIALTVVEGSTDASAICIEIAQTKSTIVDLGELDPGEYTISATNSQIPPVTVSVT